MIPPEAQVNPKRTERIADIRGADDWCMGCFRFAIEEQQNQKAVPEDVLETRCFHGRATPPRGVVGANGKAGSELVTGQIVCLGGPRNPAPNSDPVLTWVYWQVLAGMTGDRSDLNRTLNELREFTAATVSDEAAILAYGEWHAAENSARTTARPPGDFLYPLPDIIAIDSVPTRFRRANAEKHRLVVARVALLLCRAFVDAHTAHKSAHRLDTKKGIRVSS